MAPPQITAISHTLSREVLIAPFLAVQNSSIGDLVTHSLSDTPFDFGVTMTTMTTMTTRITKTAI